MKVVFLREVRRSSTALETTERSLNPQSLDSEAESPLEQRRTSGGKGQPCWQGG